MVAGKINGTPLRTREQKATTGRNIVRLKKTILAPRRTPRLRSEGSPLLSAIVCDALRAPAGTPSRASRSDTPSRRKPQLGQNLIRSEAGWLPHLGQYI